MKGEDDKHRVNFNGLEVEILLTNHDAPSSRIPFDVKVSNPTTEEEIIDELTELDRIALKTGAQYVILDTVTYRKTLDTAYVNTSENQVIRKMQYQRQGCSCCKD